MMNIYSYPPLISGAVILVLGIFVLTKDTHASLNRIFGLMCLSIFIWLGSYGLVFSSKSPEEAMFWIHPVYVGVMFIPITVHHLSIIFLDLMNRKNKLLIKISYALGAIMILLTWTGHFFNGVPKYFWGYYPRAGSLYNFFMLFFGFFYGRGLILFLLANRKIKREEIQNSHRAAQVKYLCMAFAIALVASVDYLAKYGIEVYPFGYIFMLCFVFIIAYAIVAHQLLDIEVVIRRTVVFAGLFTFAYGTFTVFTMLGQGFFKNVLGWDQWSATIPTVILITVALRPLENWLTNVTERFLFQKKFDYRDLLRTFTNEVLTVLDLQKLTEQTVAELGKIIKLESTTMILLDKDAKVYKIAASIGVKDKNMIFSEDDIVITYLKQTNQHILKDKTVDKMDGHSHLRDDFKKLNAQLCLPISHHDSLIGVLSLGMKKSGEEFTPEDIDILMTLARTLGIAIANAQLFDQLSKTQAEAAQREKMAVIGTLAAGINHEICNPLGIVRGQCEMFLLNIRDGIYNSKNRDEICQIATEIMNKVIKETDRATGITKRLSSFAKPAKKGEVEEVFVEKEVDEVLGLIGHDLKLNNIKFNKEFAADFPPIFADKRQVQEVLFNIIRNAAQAMDKKDGKIDVSGTSANGIATIKISDNGSGIPADKIGQIFNPFFTTKEPGKGTGLGLFIVRQVVERNKGAIAVESQEGMGTTFTLSFPIAQPIKAIAA